MAWAEPYFFYFLWLSQGFQHQYSVTVKPHSEIDITSESFNCIVHCGRKYTENLAFLLFCPFCGHTSVSRSVNILLQVQLIQIEGKMEMVLENDFFL